MNEDLVKMSCEECPVGTAKMTEEEIAVLHQRIPGWLIISRDGVPQLQREYPFGDFPAALAFTIVIAAFAEREKHHPTLVTERGNVRVSWWTPQVGGLHRNDFIMAAKTDATYQQDTHSRIDPLEESPIIREKRLKTFLKGFRAGLQQKLLQQVLVNVVRARFPGLTEFAEHQVVHFTEPDILDVLIQRVAAAPDASVVRRMLEAEGEM